MIKIEDVIGKKFNKLTVVKYIGVKNHNRQYLCMCDCGKQKIVRYSHLKNGSIKSCGCLLNNKKSITHGLWHFNPRLYKIWQMMIDRCKNKKSKSYKYYGNRGINVCEKWHDAKKFMEWAIKNGYKDDLTIERIDVNGNYCPENCKFITKQEQTRNKRTNTIIEINGEKKCMAEWSEKMNIDYRTLLKRIKNGTIKNTIIIKNHL